MQLSPAQYDEFWRRGWTVVEGLFAAPEVDAIIDLATSLCEKELESDVSTYTADQSDSGTIAPRKLSSPFLKHRDLRTFVMDRRLRSLVEQVIGKPPLLVFDQIFMKPPRFGSAKPYHQDSGYFLLDPADGAITAWIAMDDVDESNGCLRYIDESHRGPLLEHLPLPDEPHTRVPAAELIDLTREAPACVGKGGVVLHHCKTLHTSHRNESDNWRRAYATHWASAEVTSGNDTIKDGYYNQYPEMYDRALAASAG